MRVGILGSGLMGGKLGALFARAGHEVVFSYARSEQKLASLARHIDALALRVVEPAVIATAETFLLDAAPFERRAAVRAMRVEGADPSLLVAEHDDLLAQKLFLPRQVA